MLSRLNRWRFPILAAAAYFALPMIAAPILTQNPSALLFSRPCAPTFCCFPTGPDHPLGALILFLVIAVFFVVAIVFSNIDQKKRDAKLAEDKKKWPWLQYEKVNFLLNGKETQGVVTHQLEDKVWVRYLTYTGDIGFLQLTVADVTVIPKDIAP